MSLLTGALVAAGAETRRGLGYSIPKRRDARLVTSAPAIAGPVSVLAVLTLSGFGLMLRRIFQVTSLRACIGCLGRRCEE